MLIIGSIINIKENSLNDVKQILSKYPQIETYSVSEDNTKMVVVFEVAFEDELEKICSELKGNDSIIDIGHHYFNNEEQIEDIMAGKIRPDLSGFGKRKNTLLK